METASKKIVLALVLPALTIGTDFAGALMLVTPIENEFGVDITTTQWVLNIYALTFAMGQVAGGRLADMFGRRRMLVLGLALFALASLGCTVAPTVGWLIGARAAQGIGAALLWPSMIGLAVTSVRESDRAQTLGLVMGCVTAGNILGPAFAGIVGGLGDWRYFFVANVVFGVASVIIVPLCFAKDERASERERVDVVGMLTLAVAILALMYSLDVGADWGWGSLRVIGLFTLSIILMAVFPIIEGRVSMPMIPVQMMRNRHLMMALFANGLVMPATFLLFLYVAQYLNKVEGWSVLKSSLGTLPVMVCLSAMSVVAGRMYDRLGPRAILSIGYGIVSVGAGAMMFITVRDGLVVLFVVMVLIGAGAGLTVASAGNAAVSAVPPKRAGLVSGISFTFHLSIGAIGVAAATAILAATSAAQLDAGLHANDVTLSTADRATLSARDPDDPDVRAIFTTLGPEKTKHVESVMREAFTAGIRRAYIVPLALCVIGLFVCLGLSKEELERDRDA